MVKNEKIFFLYLILFNMLYILVSSIYESVFFTEIGILINFIIIFIHYSKNIFENITVIMFYIFLLTFILFIPLSNLILRENLYLSETTAYKTNLIILNMFLGLITGFLFGEFRRNNTHYNSLNNDSFFSIASLTMVVITAPFAIYTMIKLLSAVEVGGYVGLYQENSDSLLDRVGYFNMSFVYIYLATLPKYSLLKKSMVIIVPLMIMDILTGRRGVSIVNIMILVTYFIVRKQIIEKENIELNIIKVIQFLILGITLIFISIAVSQLRLNQESELSNSILNFFKQQSSMYNTIEHIIGYEDTLKKYTGNYSLQALYNGTFLTSVITNNIAPQSLTAISFESNLGNAITYLRDPIYYGLGGKYGTSYIAELYLDYNYIGVVIYNVFLGYFISIIKKINLNNFLTFSIVLFLLRTIYFMPRESTFNWVNQIISTTNILSIIIVLLFGYALKNLKK